MNCLPKAKFSLSLEPMFTLRPARFEDAEILHQWRNDPDTRAMSTTPDEVPWETHVEWLTGKLADPDCRFLIAEQDGMPTGTVRFDGKLANWTVAPDFRGQGVGKEMVRLAVDGEKEIVAHIRAENQASRRIAEAAGFALHEGGEMEVWITT